ncbi:MAG TPA: chemotaxis protein CheW [Pseudobdellovibrionaceae bacterium]|nr:chemotaxis protein CheW [Pseudobdellovibrionaceae bacterium]
MNDYTSKAKHGQYLTFQIKEEFYGLPIETVREINRVGDITPVPKTPPFVRGVMNLRGKIIPVVCLRSKFMMEEQSYTRDTCIIVIDAEIGQVGMIVDAVRDVVSLTDAQIEPAPVLGNSKSLGFVTGMGKLDNKIVILLDCVATFSAEQMALLANMSYSTSSDNNKTLDHSDEEAA